MEPLLNGSQHDETGSFKSLSSDEEEHDRLLRHSSSVKLGGAIGLAQPQLNGDGGVANYGGLEGASSPLCAKEEPPTPVTGVPVQEEGQLEMPPCGASPRRFFVLAMFLILNFTNQFQVVMFSTIVVMSAKYFDTSHFMINMMSIAYLICASILAFPTCVFFERFGLKQGLLGGTFLNFAGAATKFAAVMWFPNIYLVLFGQTLCGVAQMSTLSLAPLVSFTWFPATERARATSIGSNSALLGDALGMMIPPLIIPDEGWTKDQFLIVFGSVAALALIGFLGTVIGVPKEPAMFPCEDTFALIMEMMAEKEASGSSGSCAMIWKGMKVLVKNRSFMIATLVMMVVGSVVTGVGTVVAQLFLPFGVSEATTGLSLGLGMVLGCIASGFTGTWVDKKRKYKSTMIFCIVSYAVIQLIVAIVAWKAPSGNIKSGVMAIGTGLAIIFMIPFMPIFFEFVAELTYPVNPVVAPTVGFWVVSLFGAAFTFTIAAVIGNNPSQWDGIGSLLLIAGCYFLGGGLLYFFCDEDLRRYKAEQERRQGLEKPGKVAFESS